MNAGIAKVFETSRDDQKMGVRVTSNSCFFLLDTFINVTFI